MRQFVRIFSSRDMETRINTIIQEGNRVVSIHAITKPSPPYEALVLFEEISQSKSQKPILNPGDDLNQLKIIELSELGIDVHHSDKSSIKFMYQGAEVTYFAKKQWATGATIQDGRGWDNLIKQLSHG